MRLVLSEVVDLSAVVLGRQIIAAGIGAGDRLALLLGSVQPGKPVDPSSARIPGGEHDPIVTITAAIVADPTGRIQERAVENLRVPFPLVQPLIDGRLLIVNSRVVHGGPANGYLVGIDGHLEGTIMLGDGTAHVLGDSLDRIWVGYFDEGIFGNLGWGAMGTAEPIGSAGLVRFDLATGEPDWEFDPPPGSDSISDCYALNVDGETAWTCYYGDFDLVHVDERGATSRWAAKVSGVGQIVCDGRQALLVGGYGDHASATLWTLGDGQLVDPRRVRVAIEGSDLRDATLFSRGATLHALWGGRWFSGSLDDIQGGPVAAETPDRSPSAAEPGAG